MAQVHSSLLDCSAILHSRARNGTLERAAHFGFPGAADGAGLFLLIQQDLERERDGIVVAGMLVWNSAGL